MHRVVTKYRDQGGMWIVEKGPWHASLSDAETWCKTLRALGYKVELEHQHGNPSATGQGSNDDLRDALASMA